MKSWEIERLFQEDIREKRKTGSGSFHKRGKGVKHGLSGALKTPYHYMKAKEKNKLSGEVRTFNMYETIVRKEEFLSHDKEMQKNMMIHWRDNFSNEEIKKGMGIANKALYDIISDLELPKKRRGGYRRTKLNKPEEKVAFASAPIISAPIISAPPEPEPIKEELPKEEEPVKLITNGLHLEYNGEYTAEQLSKIFTKLQLITDGEENKFVLSVSLSERIDNR